MAIIKILCELLFAAYFSVTKLYEANLDAWLLLLYLQHRDYP